MSQHNRIRQIPWQSLPKFFFVILYFKYNLRICFFLFSSIWLFFLINLTCWFAINFNCLNKNSRIKTFNGKHYHFYINWNSFFYCPFNSWKYICNYCLERCHLFTASPICVWAWRLFTERNIFIAYMLASSDVHFPCQFNYSFVLIIFVVLFRFRYEVMHPFWVQYHTNTNTNMALIMFADENIWVSVSCEHSFTFISFQCIDAVDVVDLYKL